jgi:COP9 signalosome complex subunit 5
LNLQNAEYTTGQIFDLSDKLEQSESSLGRSGIIIGGDPHEKKGEDKLSKATKDSCKTTIEVIHGLMTQIIKNRLFNQASCKKAIAGGPSGTEVEMENP